MATRSRKSEPPAVVKTRAALGKALGRSVRTVADYFAAGMPNTPGAYDVAACKSWIADNVRPAADTAGEGGSLQEQIRRAELDNKLESARARKLKNDQFAKKLYHADDIERGAAELVGRIKLRLEQLPDEVAQCVAAKERRTVRERVGQVIDGMLLEMAGWEPIELTADET